MAAKPPHVFTPDQLTPTARPWTSRGPAECAWPIVVRGETYSCCAPAEGVYCRSHARLAYTGQRVVDDGVRRSMRALAR